MDNLTVETVVLCAFVLGCAYMIIRMEIWSGELIKMDKDREDRKRKRDAEN